MKITQNNTHGENHANINGEDVELFQTKGESLKESWKWSDNSTPEPIHIKDTNPIDKFIEESEKLVGGFFLNEEEEVEEMFMRKLHTSQLNKLKEIILGEIEEKKHNQAWQEITNSEKHIYSMRCGYNEALEDIKELLK